MAMILDAFVGRCMDKLSEVIEGEISTILGVKGELKKLQKRMEWIAGYLESAEQKRYVDRNINNLVMDLKDIAYDAEDIMERCMIEGSKLLEDRPSKSAVRRHFSLLSCFSCLKFRHVIGSDIRELNDRWKEFEIDRSNVLSTLQHTRQLGDQVSRVNHRQTVSMEIKSDIVGAQIEEATKSLVESLTKKDDDNRKYRVLGIVGMGGIGKTTLASHLYNDETIKENFPIRVWACVSQEFSDIRLLKDIISGAGGEYREDETKENLVSRLSSMLSKSFFIVLDDVWRIDVWEDLLRRPFENAAASGEIVITTRDTNVARNVSTKIHHVNKMDKDGGWELLCKIVFRDDDEEEEISSLKEIGVQIVEKCDGLPLAIKVIAGVLRSKQDRSNLEWNKVLKSEVWSMSQLQEQLPRALFLSYECLPSDLKPCFLYCSLFPEDYPMNRDELIRYWVAEGFVRRTQGDTIMEDLAEDFCKELIGRNLLQPCDEDGDLSDLAGNYCKMHDLLRSLAHFLIRDESIFLGDEQSPDINPLRKLRRFSMLSRGEILEVPDVIKQQKCLRTLLVWSDKIKMVGNELFESLRFLRIMNLSSTELESLPDSVGDLLHLRFLNLSWSKIRELPESIGCLVNLHVLNLSACESLHTLPKSITKLCNLRCLCLEKTQLTHVPKGISKLEHLNRLQGFVIGHDDGRYAHEGCDLKELQSLSQLRFLEIKRLERTQPAGAPVLANSRSLRTLILECKPPEDEEEATTIQRNDKIYNELSPQSTHLQKLEIHNFIGTGFFSWMISSPLSTSFPNLTFITLDKCISFPQLPPLGLLPQLKTLFINEAHAIKTIGPEFLGPRPSSAAISFPKLEELILHAMDNLEEWSFGMVEGVDEERRGAPKLLPHLMKLKLYGCPKLRGLPPLGLLPELKYLHIEIAGAIKTIGPEFLGPRPSSATIPFPKLEELILHGMDNWEEWSFGMVEGVGDERRGAPKLLPHLMKLKLHGCPKLRALPPLGLLPELKYLHIEIAGAIKTIRLEFLGPCASLATTSFPKLEELYFKEMSNWEEWSFGLVEGVGEERREAPKLLPHLKYLRLNGCPKLKALPPLGLLPELKYLHIEIAHAVKTIGPFLGPCASLAATSFPKLEELEFCEMDNWEEWSFGIMERVGEERSGAFKLLPCLKKLKLIRCPKLKALPPLGLLPQLKFLNIFQAYAIKAIGPEFLGPCASSAATSFPVLEELEFHWMDNWEKWSFGMLEGFGEERRGASKLLPHLIKLKLHGCPKLRAVPPLGLLPQLKSLYISHAEIKTIGSEFFGPPASSVATLFPKLEQLQFYWMDLEEWSFGVLEEVGEERRGAPKLLPCLTKLELFSCPRLRALPEGLRHATNLQELDIAVFDDLKEINNLSSLKSLKIEKCPRLEHVKNLDKLQFLRVILSRHFMRTSTTDVDGQTERLPQWLLELLKQHSLQEFQLGCGLPLLKTFLKDGLNWPVIQAIPRVEIKDEESRYSRRSPSYIRYTKDPPTFEANMVEPEESEDW